MPLAAWRSACHYDNNTKHFLFLCLIDENEWGEYQKTRQKACKMRRRMLYWRCNATNVLTQMIPHRVDASSYVNTIFYTVFGTLINIAVTMLCAYPMARANWPMKKGFTAFFMFTMFFSGGMIPTYLLVSSMKLVNTRWALLLPGAMSIYNMIIARTFIQNSIPQELLEASQIDGCSDAKYFFSIVLPLSKAIIAVLTLYYAVGHWNAYFNAFIYLSNRALYPLQIILREILIENSIDAESLMDEEMAAQKAGLADLLQYSLIVVSTAPILCIYPFVQKYFIKGVMIGSVKG